MIVHQVVCPVFIGRTDELGAMHAARRALAQSQGSVVLIGGEAGIGKTRLLGHFLSHVERDSRRRNLASAECLEFAEQPFGPFRELYEALGGAFPGSRGESLEKREIFARIAEDLRGLAAQRATILTIEDLQWADRSSLELLVYLAARVRGTRLLIVATYRSEELARREALALALARMAREPGVARITIEPLDARQTRELLDRAAGDRRSKHAALESVARRSEGNPFFAEELLKDALDERLDGDDSIPFSIRASVTERLGSLDAEDRRILAHAAVLGYRFDPELLALTMQRQLDEIMPALKRACDLNVLAEERTDRDRFRFRHALTRDVVYEATLKFDAKRTHQRILTTLESLDDADRHLDALAYHAWAARNRPLTVRYNRLAGDAALALRALDEARVLYGRVLDGVERGGCAEAGAVEALGGVAEMQGRIALASDHFDRAFALFRDAGDLDSAAVAIRRACIAQNNLGNVAARGPGHAFLAAYGDRVSPEPRGALLASLARLAAVVYDNDAAREYLAAIPACGALPARARQNELIARMDLCCYSGERTAWQAYAKRLVELQDALPPFVALTSLFSLAQSASNLGLPAIADDALARAARIEAQWDFGGISNHGAGVRALHAFLYGQADAVRDEIARASAGSEAAVAVMALATVAPLAAAAYGEPALMSDAIEAAIVSSRAGGTGPTDASILGASAMWNAARGQSADALADAALVVEHLPRPTAPVLPALIAVALHGDAATAARLRHVIAMPLEDDDLPARAMIGLATAILTRRFEPAKVAAGRAVAAVAADELRRLGWPFYERLAREESGEPAASGAVEPAGTVLASPLSRREDDVARLIASGATNAEIAERLSIGLGTVEKHVTSIFEKLAIKRRTQVASKYARFAD